MTPELLKNITRELSEAISGGIISKVHQPSARDIVLKIFARGGQKQLFISADRLFSRIHLTEKKYKNPPAPPRFCAYLRSRIEDARIEAITQLPGERIVRINLVKRDEKYSLICELTGKSGNVILTNKDNKICDALWHFPEDSGRPVMPGVKLVPLTPPKTVTQEKETVEPEQGETWNQATDRYYNAAVEAHNLTTIKADLARAVKKAVTKAQRKLKNLFSDKEKAEGNLLMTKTGELLLANFHLVKKGMKEVVLQDFYIQPVAEITVALDPRKTPQDNAAGYFKKAKKAKTALTLLARRIPELEKDIRNKKEFMNRIDAIKTMQEATALEKELSGLGLYTQKTVLKKDTRKSSGAGELIRKLVSSDGFPIIAGKSGRGNDKLVKELAKPGDLWFHAKDMPGSHVLLKAKGQKKPTQKSLHEAASIAAFYSKARTSGKVEVIYTDAKNVRKPKGAKPGTVTVAEYKTVIVKPKEEGR